MKKIILLFILIFGINSIHAQLTYDYPFKTYVDSVNNLYVTGFKVTNNESSILIQKLNSSFIPVINKFYLNPGGNDRGMDLTVANNREIFITGFLFNSVTNSNDIITLKYDPDGNLIWDAIYPNPGDDKGYGIDIIQIDDEASEIYISGYKTNILGQPAFFVQRLNSGGNVIWQQEISISGKHDIATDIKVDSRYVYVTGYSYQGGFYGDDIMIVTLDKEDGSYEPADVLVHNIAGSHERPTGFTITNYSNNPVSKSRSSVTAISDNFELDPNIRSRFLTVFYDEDANQKLNVRWSKFFYNRGNNLNNVPTALVSDENENVYVTGYSMSPTPGNDLDFTTVLYRSADGSYGWPNKIVYYNNDSIPSSKYDDKASSVKLGLNGNIFVAGTSDASPFGYSVINYKQLSPNDPPTKRWTKTFRPVINIDNGAAESSSQRAALLEVDNQGQPILIAMQWNANGADWKARKYDEDGNVLYTYGEEGDDAYKVTGDMKVFDKSVFENKITESGLDQNKPNPFNPSTEISYQTAQDGLVTLKIYNMLGQEAATLVNEQKQTGTYKVRFDGSALSSGMYFYKLFINGAAIDSRRMLLLK